MFIDLDAAERAAEDLVSAGSTVRESGPMLYTTADLDQAAAILMPYAVLDAVGATIACRSSIDIGYRRVADSIAETAELTRLADRLD